MTSAQRNGKQRNRSKNICSACLPWLEVCSRLIDLMLVSEHKLAIALCCTDFAVKELTESPHPFD